MPVLKNKGFQFYALPSARETIRLDISMTGLRLKPLL
jgi:hypothetical protein